MAAQCWPEYKTGMCVYVYCYDFCLFFCFKYQEEKARIRDTR